MDVIDWQALAESRKISDGDRINYNREASDFWIVITLGLASPGMWWKGIEVFDKSGGSIKRVETSTNEGRHSVVLDTNDQMARAREGFIVLSKAKMFGVHTPVHVLTNLDQHLTIGTHNFTWLDD